MFDFQFPYFLTEEIIRKLNEDALGGGSLSQEEILNRIRDFKASNKRLNMVVGENYYMGKQDILIRKRTAIGRDGKEEVIDNMPNNRVVDNQYKKLVDQKVNYIVGKPVTFNSRNKKYAKLIKSILDADFNLAFKNAVRDSLNCGIGWLYATYENGVPVFKRIKPWELLPVWLDSEKNKLHCGIRFYEDYYYKRGKRERIKRVEIFEKEGIFRYYVDRGRLVADKINSFSPYFCIEGQGYCWQDIPLVAIRANEYERPLINNVKSLQDGLNLIISNFQNAMEEDVRNTILVLKNYDGQDLGEFRQNLATYGAVKVRSADGSQGGVDTLNIQVNSENYKAIIEIFRKAIIENAMGYDGKDDRLMGQPNQMNIMSMYSDIDLDANSMETELKRAFKKIFEFLDVHFRLCNIGNFENEIKEVIFNRDVLINENEIIENCIKSLEILSKETVVANHPWVDNLEEELKRIRKDSKKEELRGETS